MASRITMNNLRNLCGILNRMTGNPQQPYADGRSADGSLIHNTGCYYISGRNGMAMLVQMSSGGGEACPLGYNYHTKAELFDLIHAFLSGYELAQRKYEKED